MNYDGWFFVFSLISKWKESSLDSFRLVEFFPRWWEVDDLSSEAAGTGEETICPPPIGTTRKPGGDEKAGPRRDPVFENGRSMGG